MLIWLIGSETSAPVQEEVAEALASEIRIWAIRLPASTRDGVTEQLLADVRNVAKSADAGTPEELRETLALTFSDEVIRAIRGVPSLTRLASLEQVARSSRERMIVRWQAAGLSRFEAIQLADDPAIGTPPQEFLPTAEYPFRIFVADVGAGKSVIAERALQVAIRSSRESANAPVPVFLRARDISGNLEAAVRSASEGLGDPRRQGVFLVIDGADETDQLQASRIVADARVLVGVSQNSRGLITTRPLAAITGEELIQVPPLDDEASSALVSRIAGREISVGEVSGWPPAVVDAVKRPLFALLLGLSERERADVPPSTGALVDFLVRRALGEGIGLLLPRLIRLARLSTDSGGEPVRRAEIGGVEEQEAALGSGLVVDRDGSVEFGLPILAQWFAAQSILGGDPPADVLSQDVERREHWRYALAVAVATGTTRQIQSILQPLAEASPGLAAVIVEDSIARWGGAEAGPLPTSVEAAAAFRDAADAWRVGTRPVSEILLPVNAGGDLSPAAARASNGYLTVGWYLGSANTDGALELPSDLTVLGPDDPEWEVRRSGIWGGEPGWAWRWSLELMRGDLTKLLKGCALRVDSQPLVDDGLWAFALQVTGRGSLSFEPVPLDAIEDVLQGAPDSASVQLRDRVVYIDQMRARISDLRDQGRTHLESPWPRGNREMGGGWIWDPYSEDAQLARVRAVYGAALTTYQAIVEQWLPALAPRLRTYATLPATLVGNLRPGRFDDRSGGPTIQWYLTPLPPGSTTGVDIQSERSGIGDEVLPGLQEALLEARPEARAWLSGSYHWAVAADAFHGAPLAKFVYDWVIGDCRATKWAK